ncbi:MAG: UDP-N-acetylmuramate--L-alanine ligase, partial [Syntrophobacteraceae bacterium CG23_combo_of_CG06-09_8_20_14_all_50_8]
MGTTTQEGLNSRCPYFLSYGATVLCFDDKNVQIILPRIKRRAITYGLAGGADYRACNIVYSGRGSRFSVCHREEPLGDVFL